MKTYTGNPVLKTGCDVIDLENKRIGRCDLRTTQTGDVYFNGIWGWYPLDFERLDDPGAWSNWAFVTCRGPGEGVEYKTVGKWLCYTSPVDVEFSSEIIRHLKKWYKDWWKLFGDRYPESSFPTKDVK